jgi:hypothetical protein
MSGGQFVIVKKKKKGCYQKSKIYSGEREAYIFFKKVKLSNLI